MKTLSIFFFVLYLCPGLCFSQVTSDSIKCIIEYENTVSGNPNKMNIKLYKNADKYKLVRKLSDNPSETGTVTVYVDVTKNSIATVTEKDGSKKGVRAAWDDDNYIALIIEYHVLFRGIPKGKNFKKFTKRSGTETFFDKTCEVYESGLSIVGAITKYYMWNNIMLKEDSPGSSTVAVLMSEAPVFSESEFDVPADVDWNLR